MAAKLKVASGLASLQSKKYKQAARRFTEVSCLRAAVSGCFFARGSRYDRLTV